MAKLLIITKDYEERVDPELEAQLREAHQKRPDDIWDLLDHILSDMDPGYSVYLIDDNDKPMRIARFPSV